MIDRLISNQISYYLKKFPIVTLTGVRQCGKSTLLRNMYPEYEYISLEDPDIREFAVMDPRGFLKNRTTPCIIDESQRVPELFSYIQGIVDSSGEMGSFILSGSHNFLLMQSISQSLAGRTAVLTLAPFSISELKREGIMPEETAAIMLKGFYPALYSRDIPASEYFPSYVNTYIERDVRLIRNIPNAHLFMRFVRLLASRSGQVINHTELAGACGISVPTVREWMSILIQSYIIFELTPYYNNYTKRIVKSPKIYFYDTGLMCYLLGIETEKQLREHYLYGAIFETMVVAEYMKSRFFSAKETAGFFWKDSNQNEVDLLTEDGGRLKAYEIKSGATMNRSYLKGLEKFSGISGIDMKDTTCIFDGEKSVYSDKGNFVRYDEVFR